jgi:predicted TIM-barrel fold metal-dependent hydrolase
MAIDRDGDQQAAWIGLVPEEAIEPDLAICDAHHHLWLENGATAWPYPVEALLADTGAGHNVVQTVFLECHTHYRHDGPAHLRPIGETEWVAEQAEATERRRAEAGGRGAVIAAIMGHADLAMGDAVEEVLSAHAEAGGGRFRGVRYITAQDPHPPLSMGDSAAMDDPAYRAGVGRVGAMGLTYDAMVYHPQLPELVGVADACPETPIVIDHLGGILGTGPYRDRAEEIIGFWKGAMADLAARPNTFLKLGGIGMPMMGHRWDKRETPATSDELAAIWGGPIRWAVEAFGADRCLFESNYPVDGRGAGYVVLWNAFKKITAGCSDDEKRWLFHDSAARAYRLDPIGS